MDSPINGGSLSYQKDFNILGHKYQVGAEIGYDIDTGFFGGVQAGPKLFGYPSYSFDPGVGYRWSEFGEDGVYVNHTTDIGLFHVGADTSGDYSAGMNRYGVHGSVILEGSWVDEKLDRLFGY